MSDILINSRIQDILTDVLKLENLPSNASQENIAEWDSMAYLNILVKLEEEFDLEINQDNINNFDSITNIMNEINRCNHR